MNSVLSQEEINALLNDTFAENDDDSDKSLNTINDMEKDTLGELANISMGAAATTMSALLGKKVEITTPRIELTTTEEIMKQFTKPCVVVDVNYNKGLKGNNIMIIHSYDAAIIVDLMMGGDGSQPPQELNDLHLSAISEAMNQMMGSSCTSLSQILSKRIDIEPPTLKLDDMVDNDLLVGKKDDIVRISFRIVIQGLIDSEMMLLIPVPFAKELAAEMLSKNDMSQYQPKAQSKDNEFTRKTETKPEKSSSTDKEIPPQPRTEQMQSDKVAVSPVQFGNLTQESVTTGQSNLELILDIGLQLSVELGRTRKRIKEILELSVGSILELDKLAGEPVDILINGKLLAKGEVVVIDENFGVRVIEIISPLDRVKNLK